MADIPMIGCRQEGMRAVLGLKSVFVERRIAPYLASVLLLVLLIPVGQASAAHAQTAAASAAQSSEVMVPVVVHGKHGELVQHLTAADFTLTDNTHPQTIQSFSQDNGLPLTLGALFETGAAQ